MLRSWRGLARAICVAIKSFLLTAILFTGVGCSLEALQDGLLDPSDGIAPGDGTPDFLLPDPGTAIPSVQNGFGGSGTAVDTNIAEAFVLFQNDFASKLVNRDGGATQKNGVAAIYSFGIYSDPNDENKLKLLVVDRDNHRILIYNSIPKDGTAEPDVVVGQNDFVSGVRNAGGDTLVSAAGFDAPVHVSVCTNGAMLVSDRNNNRVMAYDRIPTSNGVSADFVIGKPNFTDTTESTGATGMDTPYAAYCVNNQLLINDRGNNRIAVYSSIPNSSTPAASFAIGQADLNSDTGGCAANKLKTPYELAIHDNKLYIADGGNHRVLVYNSIPEANDASADAVLGQADFTSCSRNQDGSTTPSSQSLYFPNALAIQGDTLGVSDHSNNRIMFFSLPASTNQFASTQFGQADFISAVASDPSASTLGSTKSLVFDGDFMWVGDGRNKRLGVYPLPF